VEVRDKYGNSTIINYDSFNFGSVAIGTTKNDKVIFLYNIQSEQAFWDLL